jgi:hypothetical protein
MFESQGRGQKIGGRLVTQIVGTLPPARRDTPTDVREIGPVDQPERPPRDACDLTPADRLWLTRSIWCDGERCFADVASTPLIAAGYGAPHLEDTCRPSSRGAFGSANSVPVNEGHAGSAERS